jgi:hypothetical protein
MTRAQTYTLALSLGAIPLIQATPPISLMMTVGCVETDGRDGFTLTRATEPAAIQERIPAQPAADVPLGDQTLRLVGTLDEFGVAAHVGHKVWAKGLLNPGEPVPLLNLTSITRLGQSCGGPVR